MRHSLILFLFSGFAVTGNHNTSKSAYKHSKSRKIPEYKTYSDQIKVTGQRIRRNNNDKIVQNKETTLHNSIVGTDADELEVSVNPINHEGDKQCESNSLTASTLPEPPVKNLDDGDSCATTQTNADVESFEKSKLPSIKSSGLTYDENNRPQLKISIPLTLLSPETYKKVRQNQKEE